MPQATATELPPGWCLLLDLGSDTRATESDVLCLEATLREAGIETGFYPWHPAADVLTPVGAVRPIKLFVPSPQLDEARALRDQVLWERRSAVI